MSSPTRLYVTQISSGRYHHFHLARQLERLGLLEAIFTGYPRFKLRDETGIPKKKIKTFPWLQAPYMARSRFGLDGEKLSREWAWRAVDTLDWYAARHLDCTNVLIALSGSGLRSGKQVQAHGGYHICDRGSSHIHYQNRILKEEFARWKIPFAGIDPRMIVKEEAEYAQADRITVPSQFVYRSFVELGVPEQKLAKVSYGARLDRFRRVADTDDSQFEILFVGQISLRKGFLYLLEAFQHFSHPTKKLTVIGAVMDEIKPLLARMDTSNIQFLGAVPNTELASYFSRAQVMVLPSIEEGLSMVQGEALACGCPVIATTHTGSEDLYTNGVEGFIIPPRESDRILECLERLADDPSLAASMQHAALQRVKQIGGWDDYGDKMAAVIREVAATN